MKIVVIEINNLWDYIPIGCAAIIIPILNAVLIDYFD